MIRKVDHIAIAVKDLEASKRMFIEAFGAELIIQKENPEGQYTVAIFKLGENTISMLESTSPDGFVAKHIERNGQGIQHVGIEVDNLDEIQKHWEKYGFKTSNYAEKPGIKREVLLSPKNGFGIIFQIMDWLGELDKATNVERMKKAWG